MGKTTLLEECPVNHAGITYQKITALNDKNARRYFVQLYGACARVARDMGYKWVITYTLVSESGASLKASGFRDCGEAGGVSWDMPSRPREVTQVTLFGEERKYPDKKRSGGKSVTNRGFRSWESLTGNDGYACKLQIAFNGDSVKACAGPMQENGQGRNFRIAERPHRRSLNHLLCALGGSV